MRSIETKQRGYARGMVSLFVVIFSSLLLTVLSVGFIRLMIQEQQAAANNDLSQSAYDSAVAGVEDGKRVLKKCADGSDVACNAIAKNQCDTVTSAQVISSGQDEVKIRSSGSQDTSMNQAYTCVKVNANTDDVLVNLREGQSMVVPLKAVGEFKKIRLSWMHKNTGGSTYVGGDADKLEPPTAGEYQSLPPKNEWNESAASLLRAQTVLPPSGSFGSVEEFDTKAVSTTFLRPANVNNRPFPTENGFSTQPVMIGVARAAGSEAGVTTNPRPVACSSTEYDQGGYACREVLEVDGASIPPSNIASLRLTSLYRDTSVRIELLAANNQVVKFDGVQPEVDSTGRASNVFRRISSRVSLAMGLTAYPEYAVDTTDGLCKDFYVTAQDAGGPQDCK